jgi:hypothetical protein
VEVEFGSKKYMNKVGIYLATEIDTINTHWDINVTCSTHSLNLKASYSDNGKPYVKLRLLSQFTFSLGEDFFSLTNLSRLGNHLFLIGTETKNTFFMVDYWELRPLIYITSSLRYDTTFHPEISLTYIPHIDVTTFFSLSRAQIIGGARFLGSTFCVFMNLNTHAIEGELFLTREWYGCKTTGMIWKDAHSLKAAGMLEYSKEIKKGLNI